MSEGFKGNYAPELFNELKRYYLLQAQEKISLTDAELRDLNLMSNTFTRRFIQAQVGDCAVDDGFKIVQHSSDTANNFSITGGDGSLDSAGNLFLKGYRLSLRNDIGYKDQTNNGDITTDAYTTTILPSLTTPGGTIQDINSITKNAAGRIVAVCSDSTVIEATDWKNFSVSSASVAPSFNLYDAEFGDATSVYAVGTSGSNGKILRDIGAGWVLQSSWAYPLYGITSLNASNMWVVGNGIISRTTDGGGSWTNTAISGILYAVDAYDTSNVWAVGADGSVTKWDSLSWDDKVGDTTQKLNAVITLSPTTVIMCGNVGVIQKTTTGDVLAPTWSLKNSDTTNNLNDIFFDGALRGRAVGDNGVYTHSEDGGNTWDATIINSSYNFKSVLFSDTTGFIVGINGIIYRTLNDGTTWDRYRTDYAYVDFHLAEVSADETSEYTDSTLIDTVVGPPSANRLRIVQDVKVSEGWPVPSDYTYTGVDGTVQQHYIYALAKIQRSVGVSAITTANITDLRTVNKTIAELNNLLTSGGIDSSALADGAVTPAKMDSGADYTFGSTYVTGDALIDGDLTIGGVIHVDSTIQTSIIVESLEVLGSSQLGDTTRPYDDTAEFYGQIIQNNDVDAPAYSVHNYSTTINSPVISILQDGSGSALKILKTSDSTNCLIDVTSSGKGYDVCVTHLGTAGGVLKAWDDSTNDTAVLTKDATGSTASVLNLTSNAYGPIVKITNNALCPSSSIKIDQSSGTAILIQSKNDASSVVIQSTGTGTDLKILHSNFNGTAIDMTSSAEIAILLHNIKGKVGSITQKDNKDIFTLTKDGTGAGRVIEANSCGYDPVIQINADGSGIGLHVSKTGDSTVPAVDIFVAGSERGPGLRVTKSNNDSTDDIGQAVYVWNRGFSQSLQILQDHTDSTAATVELRNLSHGDDASSINWRIDNSGNFITNGGSFFFDSTHYVSSTSFLLDGINFDSSNPAVDGGAFIESGFLRISDGTTPLPSPSWGSGSTGLQGQTGPAGVTGIVGLGETGLQGLVGETGIRGEIGDPGPYGATGLIGPYGHTGIRGETGSQGQTGIRGHTGPPGPSGLTGAPGITGSEGPTGLQGLTGTWGITGFEGITGVQGITGIAPSGITGIQGQTGFYGSTGVQGVTGFYGQTGVQGVTGFYGQTGLQGVTGFYGQTGSEGQTGIQGLTGFYGQTGVQGGTGIQGQTGTGLANIFIESDYPVHITPSFLWNTTDEALFAGISGIDHWVQISAGAQAGITGAMGFTGLALGSTGIQGPTGFCGQTGVQGETGIQGFGSQGETGIQGLTGFYGQTGIQGFGETGIQGTVGSQGETGIQGLTGFYGQTGIQGLTGFYGQTGIQGLTGFYGQTGLQGTAGITGATDNYVAKFIGTDALGNSPIQVSGNSIGINCIPSVPVVVDVTSGNGWTVISSTGSLGGDYQLVSTDSDSTWGLYNYSTDLNFDRNSVNQVTFQSSGDTTGLGLGTATPNVLSSLVMSGVNFQVKNDNTEILAGYARVMVSAAEDVGPEIMYQCTHSTTDTSRKILYFNYGENLAKFQIMSETNGAITQPNILVFDNSGHVIIDGAVPETGYELTVRGDTYLDGTTYAYGPIHTQMNESLRT